MRVKRPGLHVRSRQGFFGPAAPDESEPAANNPLLVAALSPFGSGDITVRLTTVFGHDGTRSSFVRSLLFIDPADVPFSRDTDGRYVADLQLMVQPGPNRPRQECLEETTQVRGAAESL